MAHRRKQGLTLATNLMVWTWDSGTCRLPPQILQSDWAPFTVANSLQNAASKETCLGQAKSLPSQLCGVRTVQLFPAARFLQHFLCLVPLSKPLEEKNTSFPANPRTFVIWKKSRLQLYFLSLFQRKITRSQHVTDSK